MFQYLIPCGRQKKTGENVKFCSHEELTLGLFVALVVLGLVMVAQGIYAWVTVFGSWSCVAFVLGFMACWFYLWRQIEHLREALLDQHSKRIRVDLTEGECIPVTPDPV